MSLFRQIGNKINYTVSQWASDPNADAYAKQQALQAQQDAETQERLNRARSQASADAQARRDSENSNASLAERSQFKPGRAANKTASGILKGFRDLI